jgi:hypothetical protein
MLFLAIWLGVGGDPLLPEPQIPAVWSHQLEPGVVFTGEHRELQERLSCACSTTAGSAFLGEDQLVTYQVFYRAERLGKRKPEDVEGSPYFLRFVSFDLSHGSTNTLGELPATPEWNIVKRTCCGWAIRTGNEVRLTNDDLGTRVLIPAPTKRNFEIAVSPDGKSVLVMSWDMKRGDYVLYDARSFTVRDRWTGSPGLAFNTISNQEILFSSNCEVDVAGFGEEFRQLFVCKPASKPPYCWFAQFVSDDAIAVAANRAFLLFDRDRQAYQETLCNDCRIEMKFATSKNGAFVAVWISTEKRNAWLDSGKTVAQEISIYDLKQWKKISTISIMPLPKHHFDFALSPSGSKLAVLDDWQLSVFPVQSAATASGLK